MAQTILKAENLSKMYTLGRYDPYRALRAYTKFNLRKVKRAIFRQPPLAAPKLDENAIWALKDISFEIKRGEAVGIIGRNGAGKSTLLKILSRITKPTAGYADMYGTLGSILEVGTGFHPDLTGRENIYLNGSILGLSKKEIDHLFDEIVAFTELEKFIDTPVKYYSSGMYVRLAFAVAAYLERDILLIDEVLAVGDAAFQKKCLGKMEGIAGSGRTILFVSHSISSVRALCTRAIWLDQGQVTEDGDVNSVTRKYVESLDGTKSNVFEYEDEVEKPIKILQAEILPDQTMPSDFIFRCTYRVRKQLPDVMLCTIVRNSLNTDVFYANDDNIRHPDKRLQGTHVVSLHIPAHHFAPGEYSISYGFWEPGHEPLDFPQNRIWFRVDDGVVTRLSAHNIPWPSVVYEPNPKWEFIS
jgi:lipopolysaccharide transport system ATP-binding protein